MAMANFMFLYLLAFISSTHGQTCSMPSAPSLTNGLAVGNKYYFTTPSLDKWNDVSSKCTDENLKLATIRNSGDYSNLINYLALNFITWAWTDVHNPLGYCPCMGMACNNQFRHENGDPFDTFFIASVSNPMCMGDNCLKFGSGGVINNEDCDSGFVAICEHDCDADVDGQWGTWSSFGSCSVPCGGPGLQTRTRDCDSPAPVGAGNYCFGLSFEDQACDNGPCPVDGAWSPWSPWGPCDVSCGGGLMNRTRACDSPLPQNGGSNCIGSEEDITACNTQNCPIDGAWSAWTAWDPCDLPCGTGSQSRTRLCNSPSPQYGGNTCPGLGSENQACNTHNCPIDGMWGAWTAWDPCDQPCGTGSQSRIRLCDSPSPQYGGSACPGLDNENQACNTHNCPIDGMWGAWSVWDPCDQPCGTGSQSRSRLCDSPPPQFGGNTCPGSGSENQACNTHNCPVDGMWGAWSIWDPCDLPCGTGSQSRTRLCDSPPPQYGGNACPGSGTDNQACNTHNCPIDGGWSNWVAWTTCTATCDGGTTSRTRLCDNPTPQFNGLSCPGSSTEEEECNITPPCPIHGDWSAWGQWGTCSETCGLGSWTRTRSCDNPLPTYGGDPCSGSSSDVANCNIVECPVDGNWSPWSLWTGCIGMSTLDTRQRNCDSPAPDHGGDNCVGPAYESNPCPPVWSAWSTWSTCSASCAYGVQTHTRWCSYSNMCSGTDLEVQYCDVAACHTSDFGPTFNPYWLSSAMAEDFRTNANAIIDVGVNTLAPRALCATHCKKARSGGVTDYANCNAFSVVGSNCHLSFADPNWVILTAADSGNDERLFVDIHLP